MRLEPINLYDYEARAKQVLPHNNWEFIEAGSMDEITTARNRTAFESLTLRPRFMRDTTERKVSTTVLGQDISFPVMNFPHCGHGNAHPEAECATARGAGMSNTLMMCSTSSNCSMEEIAEAATGPLWFQLYHRGYDLTENLVKRAEVAGFGPSSSRSIRRCQAPRSATCATGTSVRVNWATSGTNRIV